MVRDWENWLRNSIGPASATEEQDRDRTEKRIRDAIMADSRLASNVRVFVKGSYANNTNVRRDSDVDIAVEWKSWAYITKTNAAAEYSWEHLGVSLGNSGPTPAEYRQWVQEAVIAAFGGAAVDVGGKTAITVTKGSTTLDADVVPCFRLSRYTRPGGTPQLGNRVFLTNGEQIENWPAQHKTNSIAKNTATAKRYKQLVRALKRLENDMVNDSRLEREVQGYFIECLLYNLLDGDFGATSYKNAVLQLLAKLWHAIQDDAHKDWVEVNRMKWLWRDGQTWTPTEASNFAYAAWNYISAT
jgi:predicted nucleotidyltransferase